MTKEKIHFCEACEQDGMALPITTIHTCGKPELLRNSTPCGYSNWEDHGVKYGYLNFYKKKIIDEIREKNCRHTKHPKNYQEHSDWADKMQKTHFQIKCPNCGLYALWVKK